MPKVHSVRSAIRQAKEQADKTLDSIGPRFAAIPIPPPPLPDRPSPGQVLQRALQKDVPDPSYSVDKICHEVKRDMAKADEFIDAGLARIDELASYLDAVESRDITLPPTTPTLVQQSIHQLRQGIRAGLLSPHFVSDCKAILLEGASQLASERDYVERRRDLAAVKSADAEQGFWSGRGNRHLKAQSARERKDAALESYRGKWNK